MTLDIINDRLRNYEILTKQSELNAIKEISQEIALAGLARAGFLMWSLPKSVYRCNKGMAGGCSKN